MATLLHRARSKDRTTSNGSGLYMNQQQMGDYLQDLRSHRVQRPPGPRPAHSASDLVDQATLGDKSYIEPLAGDQTSSITTDERPAAPYTLRRPSAFSHRRNDSNTSSLPRNAGRPLVPQPGAEGHIEDIVEMERVEGPVPYVESGQRWMERAEARSLRIALEDMDLIKEQKLHNAAQDEASDLVWKHQNSHVPYPAPGTPYNYREHLQKGVHGRQQSWSTLKDAGPGINTSSTSRSGSGGSASIRSKHENNSTAVHPLEIKEDGKRSATYPQVVSDPNTRPVDSTDVLFSQRGRRRTSNGHRKASGPFINPTDQIYEEPEDIATQEPAQLQHSKSPAPVPEQKIAPASISPTKTRRNPFCRVQQAKESLTRSQTAPLPEMKSATRKLSQRLFRSNPNNIVTPSSDVSGYVSNNSSSSPTPPASRGPDEEPANTKDGKEIRSDDIRAATSMRMRDRSPKLPTPTMVSDAPGRPIVSFETDWKPREKQLEQAASQASGNSVGRPGTFSLRGRRGIDPQQSASLSNARSSPLVTGSGKPTHNAPVRVRDFGDQRTKTIPSISFSDASSLRATSSQIAPINNNKAPPIPMIAVSDESEPKSRPIPTINFPDDPARNPPSRPLPSISVHSAPAIPTISVDPSPSTRPLPTISVSNAPSIPTISVDPAGSSTTRPLPTPRRGATFPRPNAANAHRGNSHWTPTTFNSGALCSHCALPISGRTVSAAGARFHPECFGCYHCGEKLECVAFYPEPDNMRAERVDRIRRRQAGEIVEGFVTDGVLRGTEADDGDEGMRFYCHLDFHEFFSPRCKSCKTPIEGEVVVACGAEWHVGHFFCAQCGDPFDPQTPFVEKDNYAWCINCHTNRYSAKCKKCRKPVTDMVVKALGAEWHEKCFSCTECNGPFLDGRYFLRDSDSDPVCVGCEERRLKA